MDISKLEKVIEILTIVRDAAKELEPYADDPTLKARLDETYVALASAGAKSWAKLIEEIPALLKSGLLEG